MPRNVHRATFVPEPIGIAYVQMDVDGRIVVPSDLRGSFRDQEAPFLVRFSLAGRGYVTAQSASGWPPYSERTEVERALKLLDRTDTRDLPRDHLQNVQDFARVVACRYIDGKMGRKWQMRIPHTVRAWLGLAQRRSPMGKTKRKDIAKGHFVIVLGNVGSLEVWSEESFKNAPIHDSSDFDALRAKAAESLVHATQRQPTRRGS